MKTAIVYYSLNGNTDYVAHQIGHELIKKGEITYLRLCPTHDFPAEGTKKFFYGGKSVVFGEKPQLAPYKFRKEDYDVILIGTPVWAGKFASPLATFFQKSDLTGSNVAFFASSSGGNAKKCFNKLKKEVVDGKLLSTLSLIDPYTKQKEEDKKEIKRFVNEVLKLA